LNTLFISDLHLSEERPAITRAFFDFLERALPGADALYILGDFFDVWLGDDDDAPLSRQVIEKLAEITSAGTPVYVMHGNRDFLLGDAFAADSGATLLADPTVIDLYGEKVLLMHGDSLCTDDEAYMAFRQQARSPHFQKDLLSRSLAERREIAAGLRQQSQAMNSLKAEDIMDVNPSEVIQCLNRHGVERLIHGHTHRPARHPVELGRNTGERIVLGDWHTHGWCLKVNKQTYDLDSFQI